MSFKARPLAMPAQRATAGSRPSLRVCHVAYTFYESDNRVMRYADVLAARGDEVDVIALRRAGQTREGRVGGVRVFRIQRRTITEHSPLTYLLKIMGFLVQSMCLLSVLHMRRRYDIVHVHNVPDFLVFAAWLPKLTGARVILDIHDILPELYAGKFGSNPTSILFRSLLLVERLSTMYADHVVIANHLWHARLIARGVPPLKCTPILNYPDLSVFKPNTGHRAPGGKFIVLYPGTLNAHQGVDIAVRAFARAKSQMPDAEFHIHGEGPARPELSRLVRELGLAAEVKLMDRLPLREICEIMASADVGVVPKRADGFGNEAFSTKILEFMACGVPVVVSRTRVDTHYFDDTLVRFFASGDEVALAGALIDVYRDRSESNSWVEHALEFARRNSWQERGCDYLGLLESLTQPAPDRAVVTR